MEKQEVKTGEKNQKVGAGKPVTKPKDFLFEKRHYSALKFSCFSPFTSFRPHFDPCPT